MTWISTFLSGVKLARRVDSTFIMLSIWLKHDNLHKRVIKEYQQEGLNSNNFVASKQT